MANTIRQHNCQKMRAFFAVPPKPFYYICILSCLIIFAFNPSLFAGCSLTSVGITPLNDLGQELYRGFQGGLYPCGTSARPAFHTAAGINIAQNKIQLLNAQGLPDPAGKIVLISVGMSNTTREFSVFKQRADADPAKNPKLTVVDCSQGGMTTSKWLAPNDPYRIWQVVASRLADASVTAKQVQIIWLKQAEAHPSPTFPDHALALSNYLEQLTILLKQQFPNLQIAYVSSRTRAYTLGAESDLNPEPVAFETGLSVKWLIEKQLNASADLNYDPDKGSVLAPWLSWGPYLWADGTTPRSDGFTWDCQDVVTSDYTHPSETGKFKVATQLLAFFKTDPTAAPWFLKSTATGQIPNVTASADVTHGSVPLTVHFQAVPSDPDGTIAEYAWTFDDGGFSTLQNPVKTFYAPGIYQIRLTVIDNSGNAVKRTIPITIYSDTFPSKADLNGDCNVDLFDLAIFADQWLQAPASPSADIAPNDGDGIVNYLDFTIFAQSWRN